MRNRTASPFVEENREPGRSRRGKRGCVQGMPSEQGLRPAGGVPSHNSVLPVTHASALLIMNPGPWLF